MWLISGLGTIPNGMIPYRFPVIKTIGAEVSALQRWSPPTGWCSLVLRNIVTWKSMKYTKKHGHFSGESSITRHFFINFRDHFAIYFPIEEDRKWGDCPRVSLWAPALAMPRSPFIASSSVRCPFLVISQQGSSAVASGQKWQPKVHDNSPFSSMIFHDFPLKPPGIGDFQMPCLSTGGYQLW